MGILSGLLGSLITLNLQADPSFSAVSLFDQASDTIFKVGLADSLSSDLESHGTGFVVSESGFIATAFHVIEGAIISDGKKDHKPQIYIIRKGARIRAIPWAIDSEHDLAILKLPYTLPKPWPVSTTIPKNGTSLSLLGFPGLSEFSIISGTLQNSRSSNLLPLYQITAPVTGGMSGGPVLNSNGEIIGTTLAKYSGGGDIALAGQGGPLNSLIAHAKARRSDPTEDDLVSEVRQGFQRLQDDEAGLVAELYAHPTAFHGWLLPGNPEGKSDLMCTEGSSDDEEKKPLPERNCTFKMGHESTVSFRILYKSVSPKNNQFKTADLSETLLNQYRIPSSSDVAYGSFACEPTTRIQRGRQSFLFSLCSRADKTSLERLHSVVRFSSLDFSRPGVVGQMELFGFNRTNTKKLIADFMDIHEVTGGTSQAKR